MKINRSSLYIILGVACLAGYAWLYAMLTQPALKESDVAVCPVRHFAGVPCPSCGSTRSVLALVQGHILQAWSLNPMGFVIAFILLVAPLWILADVMMRRSTLLRAYLQMERVVRKPRYAIPLISLVILNWIRNISKGL